MHTNLSNRVVEVVIVSPDPVVFRLLEHPRVLRLALHLVAFRIETLYFRGKLTLILEIMHRPTLKVLGLNDFIARLHTTLWPDTQITRPAVPSR
jgi:hypothetical protein